MYLGVQINSLPLFFYDNYKFRIEKVLTFCIRKSVINRSYWNGLCTVKELCILQNAQKMKDIKFREIKEIAPNIPAQKNWQEDWEKELISTPNTYIKHMIFKL